MRIILTTSCDKNESKISVLYSARTWNYRENHFFNLLRNSNELRTHCPDQNDWNDGQNNSENCWPDGSCFQAVAGTASVHHRFHLHFSLFIAKMTKKKSKIRTSRKIPKIDQFHFLWATLYHFLDSVYNRRFSTWIS